MNLASGIDLLVAVKGWARKAESWHAGTAIVRRPAVQEAIEALPVHRITTAYPCQDFPFPAPNYFVGVRPNGVRFLVATEGSNYARYIVRLPLDAEGRKQ